MRKRLFLFFITTLFAIFSVGIFSACTRNEDIEVPVPEIVGGEDDKCDHVYDEGVFVEATCSKRAHTEYTCTLCGHSYSIYEGEYGEHVPITIYEKGNCISYGCTKQKCSVCGIILSREFDTEFGEHDYEIKNEYYAGDCKTRGYTVVKRCKTCKKEIIEQGSYGGHRLGKTVHVDPTCVSEGYDEATCTVCGEYKERFNVVQPSEHNFKETTIPGSDCEHLTVIESRCLDCGYTVTNETDLYGPHNYVKTSSSSEHACSVCGTSAPHNVVVKDVSDTRHLSYCDVCGYQHASGTGEHCYVLSVVRDASCTGNVSIIYTCDVCGHIQSALLPMRHDYSVTSVDVATCAENGRVTLACGECGKTATESYYYAADSASVGVAPAIKLLSTAAVERSGDYVYFGSYPYSRITYPIHIDALNALAGEKPTPENAAAWTVASYCSGAAYSWYVDVTYCGEKYRGLYFTAYRPASLSAEPTADNSYVDENGYSTGVVYWFRYEKLRWSVLSSQDELLLFSCDILDAQALGASSSTWEESALRAYLNETFASVAFSAEEKAMFSGTPNVFLLTAEDIVSTAYGFTSGDTFSAPRALIASAYAWAQGLRMENYWLSPASAAEEYAVVAYGYAMDRATGHDFRETIASGSLRTAATCIAYATYYKTCSVCGALSSEYFADEEDGYALHDYEYTYTELTHRYACKACGEELLQEEHVLSYEDDLNGISHTESCSVCGYVFRKDHTFAGDNCSLCNAEKYSYDARWDVSGGENSVVAYMNGTTLTIRGKGNMVDFSAQTPAPYASYRQSICVVKIDPQVTSIGAYAFYGFSSLATITVPEQIEKIGKYAFAYAESVSYLEFNARTCGSFVVNNYVFANLGRKSAELNVTIGSAVENISAYLLCPSEDTLPRVTSLTISGASVTNIGDYAFYGISLPVNVTLPTVRSIGKYAFYNNVAAKSFILGGELSSVGDYAFYRCQDATIRVGSFLTNVGEYAFYDSHGLSSVLLGVNAVPDYAFYNTGLDLLTFSVAPTSIGNYAFFGAPLTTVLKENSSIKDFLSAATSIGDYAFYQSEINGDLSSRDLVSVGEKAFYGCRNILRVSVCALASVGKYAFAECSGLSVFDADALTSVPEGCFAGDSDLEYVFLSSSLTDVGKEAFLSCYRLTSFMLPATLSSIGVNAFKGCFTLVELDNRSSFTLKEGAVSNGYVAMYAKHIYNGAAGESSRLQTQNSLRLLQMDETWIVGYSGHFIDANLTLENNVVAYAFYKASGVKNVTVRSNVVEKYAFYEAEEINNVYLEEGCRVEENAFASCENLRSVYLETDPASVDVTAFNGDVINLLSFSLSSLTSLTESPLFTAINAQKLKMELNTEETVPEIEGYTGEKRNDYVNYTRVAAPITITGAVTPTITYTLTKIHPNGYDLSIDGIGAIPDYTANTVPWAEYIDKITKVTFSVGITRVGDYAFRGASSLFRINWEQGVTSVGDYAFCDCSALTAVHFPDDLMTIGNHAFENCSFLGDIFFNSLLSAIGEYAFAGCEETYSVQLYQGMTNVGAHAFENCKNVRYLYLPASVTTIGEYAFAGCINMQSIQFDCVNCADLARNNYVFYNCGQQGNGITLIIGDEVASIPAYLFNPVFDLKYPSPRITAITIPHELTVGDYAFRNVTSASTIDLSCASSIGSGVLSGTAPTSLVLSGLAGTLGYFFDGSNASVPVGLTSIRLTASANVPDDAFAGCSHIAFVTLPDVTTAVTIGARAFKDCSSLSDFSISCNGVTVGEDAFFGCSSLLSLSISTTTQSVSFASHAFYGCGELASVYVNNLSSVGRGAFLGCENVSSFICSGEVVVHENGGAFGLYMSEPTSATLIGFVGAASSYVVPERVSEYDLPVTVIGEEAFSSLSGLRSIVLNASVSSIEDKAFYNCVSLRSVDFNGNTAVRTIGKSAFAGCVQLRDIVLPSVIQTIGDSAFENCSSLTSFVLPAETTVLGERVFASCRKMREFVFGGRKLVSLPQGTFSSCVLLASVALPQGIETVDEGAFEQCSSLLSVSLPTGLKQIRAYAFSHCKKLTALSLPNSVVNLGEKVFNGCVGLEELQFGTGIASLGMGLLSGCKSLRSLTLPFVGASAAETRTVYPFGYIFGTSSYEGAVRTNQSIIESSTFGGETFYTYTSAAYYLPVSLKTVTVRSGSVNEGAFSGCIYLQTVDISATGVRKIGKKAFSGCSALSNIVFPDTLTTIDAEAFYYCSSLNDIVLPEKVCDESVDETAFVAKSAFTYTGYYANQNNWEEGVLYVKVRKGSDYELFAVDSSTSLERACHVKDGTVLILDNAFENSSFTEVYLPSSLRKIGSSILKGNKKISLLSVPFIGETMTKNTFLAYFFGGVLPATGSDLELSVNSSREYIPSSLSTLVLTGIGSIPDRVCHGCHTLTSVIIGEGYSSVGSYAFSNCSLLENVSVPNSLTSVGMYAFEYCTSLLSIVLPTGLTGVGKGAFSNCTAMKFYSAPFIGATPTGNQYLGFVFCPATENTPTASMNGDLVPESLEVVSISGSYPAVPASAFYGCRFIKTVLLNVKTTTIGSDAFYNCTSLSNVYIVGGTAGSTYNPTYRDEAPRHERFANASWHRIYFDSDTVTRNLSTVMQDNVYINRLNSNDVSLVMESVKYTSSDPDIAAFEYEFDENGNGVIEAIEKKDHSSDGLVTFFRKGVATVTVTIKTPTFIVSLSYTLTIS